MKKRILFTALVTVMLMPTTVSAESWWINSCKVVYDNELGIITNFTPMFATETKSLKVQ